MSPSRPHNARSITTRLAPAVTIAAPLAAVIAALTLLPACGSGTSDPGPNAPSTPNNPDGPATSPDPSDPGATPTGSDPATSPQSPSVAECNALLDHFLAVAHAEHSKDLEPEHIPTREQLAAIREQMAPEFLAACRDFDRTTHDCIAGASTQDQLARCSLESP